jgi:uracil-DNA glycosylase
MDDVSINPQIEESEEGFGRGVSAGVLQGAKKFFLLRSGGSTGLPSRLQKFAAFDFTPFTSVKVVLLGQDPYHGQGRHMDLLSVPRGIPSLIAGEHI